MPHPFTGSNFKPAEGTARIERKKSKAAARKRVERAFKAIDRSTQKTDTAIKDAVWLRDRGMCRGCGEQIFREDGSCEVHHILHRSLGGLDTLDNLCALCRETCHKAHHDGKLDIEGNPNGDLTFRSYRFKTDGSRELVRTWVSGCPA